jgi:hypothetical protein
MKSKSVIILVFSCILLMSCENPMKFETKVHEDGSLDKTILFEEIPEVGIGKNILGVNANRGWSVKTEKLPVKADRGKSAGDRFRVQFQKSFPSVTELNHDLDTDTDSLFQIHSTFEKKFRWFYTYIKYTETFRPLNRFKLILSDDYFTKEDNDFLDRLPAEGKKVSPADSLYLQLFNEKIFDHFAVMGIFKEQYQILEEVVKKNAPDKRWLDTLYKRQEFIYNQIDKMKGDPRFAEKMADTLRIPLPKPKSSHDFKELAADFNSRLNFMAFARDGKYMNVIEMPWTVVNSNADSVAGNKLYWRPLVTKFVYRDYEMVAESRKLNLWACFISIGIFGATLYLFFRGRG